MTEWYMVDCRYLLSFLALSFAAAFAVARFIRAGQGPRVSWREVTSTQPDLGPHVLGASEVSPMTRLPLVVDDAMMETLDRLAVATDASDTAEVIRNAISLYEWAREQHADGYAFGAFQDDGSGGCMTREVLLPFKAASESQRLAVAEVEEQCRAAIERGRDGCP